MISWLDLLSRLRRGIPRNQGRLQRSYNFLILPGDPSPHPRIVAHLDIAKHGRSTCIRYGVLVLWIRSRMRIKKKPWHATFSPQRPAALIEKIASVDDK